VATEDALQRRLVRRIKEVSRERKIPVTHLPDRAAVSRAHFWDVMGRRKSPTLAWVTKVAEALEVDPGELLVKTRLSK
jgi:hypothetical protein